ncbi:MAG: lipid A biosynthesis lauroyl acyltransferase [Proteobacteria bacterium]|nr:lipid A biosynthesis lauroyl acyltransferase [Pseudomonadota bacterium]MDA1022490.1 lipid A biosynthesis lauroyl acyltransferase [Pseudomonadota bacterium]
MPKLPSSVNRYFLHPLQALAAAVGYSLFRVLPIDVASAIGGWLGRTIGPRLSISGRAVKNLTRAFPEKSPEEIAAIVRGMWDNLCRVAVEYPHLGSLNIYDPDSRVEVIGAENVDLLRDDDQAGIFFSAHLGNWEIVSLGATQRDLPLDRVYREANNRLVEWLYQHGRAAVEGALIPKGSAGARLLLQSIKNGKHLGMMVDQKMNDGIPVPFFGRDVMTAPALAELALRYDCPVVPARVERLKGAHFKLIVLAPLEMLRTGDRHADVAANMAKVNAQIEQWVRDTPEQWLWLHNRWSDGSD